MWAGSPVELVHNQSAEIQFHDAVSLAETLRGRTAVYLVEEAASDERCSPRNRAVRLRRSSERNQGPLLPNRFSKIRADSASKTSASLTIPLSDKNLATLLNISPNS